MNRIATYRFAQPYPSHCTDCAIPSESLRKWEDNIKMKLKQRQCMSLNIKAEDSDKLRSLGNVKAVIKLA